jgi:hypothetical protein
MRTTVNLPEDLLQQAKLYAASRGVTLTQLLEDSLRTALDRRHDDRRSELTIPTAPGALRPGTNLDDSAALLDLMDAPGRPHAGMPATMPALWVK